MADIDWSKGSLSGPDGKPVDTTDWSSGVLTEPPKPVGGFGASAKQALGSLVKGAGQAAEDFLPASIGKDNAVKKYGQSVIDANPTAVQGFSDIADSPWMAAKEATGNAAGSMGSMLGLRALGMGITAASPLTGPFAPATALAGQAVANVGPFVAAALPSFGGIREKQIAKDPNSTASMQDKALAAAGAGTVGLIEGKFGPQAWAMKAMTKEGRAQLAKGLAETTLAKGVGYGALKGAAVEGAEELVQNPIEQLAAYEDPRTPQNIKETLFGGAMGAIGGGVLGGATGAANQMLDRTPPAAPNQAPTDQAPSLQLGNTPDPLLSFPDGTVARRSEIDAYINGLPADQQPAARAKMMGLAPQPAYTPLSATQPAQTDSQIPLSGPSVQAMEQAQALAPVAQAGQDQNTAALSTSGNGNASGVAPQPVKPSEAMGLDPAAGPLSAAAVTAVDTGAHQEIQLQQANEADQAAYEQATAEQDRQAAELDTATKPITHGPIAEAAMSDEDKRAVLFSNQAVADGGKRYAGTLDGDILNGLGKPYPNRLAAARRANMEGKDWTIAQVQDGFVARRKDANGQTNGVQSADPGVVPAGRADSPASVAPGPVDGSGAGAKQSRPVAGVLGQSGELPKRTDAAPVAAGRAQPTTLGTQTTATAGPGFTAKDVTRVQNPAPRADTTPATPAVEAPATVARDAAASEGLPNAGSAAVEAAGVARIDDAAHTAATSPLNDLPQPTEAQKIAGNYPKGHVNLNGLDLSIENPAGSVRSGKDKSGKAWSNTLQHHYGYIKGSVGNDKDHVDLFVKPGTPLDYSGQVFVIDQVHPDTGRFDEHKVVMGAKNGMEARRIYQANYAKGWKGFKALTAMPFDQFKTWVKDGPKNKPVSSEKPVSQPQEQTSAKAPKAIEATAQQQAAGPATNPAKSAASDGVAAAPEAGQPAEPVAPKSLREAVNRNRAKNAKPVEPVEQPTPPVEQPAQASSSRPGEPSAEQIESVGDVVRITKSAGKEIKRTVNASTAMKTLNERAEALQILAKACK